MIEHLFNCHGEWQVFLAAVGSIPVVGVWARALLANWGAKNESR